ncbi:ead/Ea22-like family protein [Klebsiella michiganensis]|uniref:Ead/Ea22-like family protein n=1 Tax=Klebsiella michiganensis TaxID=1134687 RepID=A0AB35Q0L3_9ENTR|nr:ead/Ea22-like family protein [Klebsiella michiganensis]MDS7846587.1 ead/Ea22-like family protein [Klebsiella michiganensis]MDS7901692.1 ead/Ea22-like family protein [Klebsiella michiganensis]MDS7918889.1 ead/Ea22-like family protein [Klebsiella michiganensis]MDU6716788.1 ead/Ea22-like family protein [Klebsiella michiganensis]
MTTDITELAQRMKAAAEKATPGNWRAFQYHDGRCGVGGGNHDEIMVCEHISKKRPHDAVFIALANPANALALVEALEKAQRMESYWKTQCRGITDHCEELQARIAELESRTVTIEPFRSFVTDADLAALHRFAECCDDPESGGHDLEKEQVRRLEAIGALQRSGRISYITGFGDVLISITSGIKVEGE